MKFKFNKVGTCWAEQATSDYVKSFITINLIPAAFVVVVINGLNAQLQPRKKIKTCEEGDIPVIGNSNRHTR